MTSGSRAIRTKPMPEPYLPGDRAYMGQHEVARSISYTSSIAASEAPREPDPSEKVTPALELHSDFHYAHSARSCEGCETVLRTTSTQESPMVYQNTTAQSKTTLGFPKDSGKGTSSRVQRTESVKTFSGHVPGVSAVLGAAAKGFVLSTAGKMLYPAR